MSDSVRSQRRQPTRLCCPWDSPGKNTGVGCHFLLQCMTVKVKVKSLSRVRLFVTPWTAAYQAPLSMEFSSPEYWSWLPFPSPGDLPDPGIKLGFPTLKVDSLPSEPPGKPNTENTQRTVNTSVVYAWLRILSADRTTQGTSPEITKRDPQSFWRVLRAPAITSVWELLLNLK